jgi:hypothetical protein
MLAFLLIKVFLCVKHPVMRAGHEGGLCQMLATIWGFRILPLGLATHFVGIKPPVQVALLKEHQAALALLDKRNLAIPGKLTKLGGTDANICRSFQQSHRSPLNGLRSESICGPITLGP